MSHGPIIAVCWGGLLEPGGDPAKLVQSVLDRIKLEGAKNEWPGNRLVDARWQDAGDARQKAEILITLESCVDADTSIANVRDFITVARLAEQRRLADGRLF